MSLSLNKSTPIFFIGCFLAMTIPYIFNMGDSYIFKQDYYAKRIMTLLSFPFFGWIIYTLLIQKKIRININLVLYLIVYCIVLLISFFKGNRIVLIITDAFIALLPVFFYLLIFNTNVSTNSYKNYFKLYLFVASILVVFGIKLQFSYFSLISVVYILFFVKWKPQNFILFALIPIIAYKSLIGKSSFLMLVFIIGYLFIFDSKNINLKKKIYLLLIPSVLLTITSIVFWDKIQETGAYRNFIYFLRNANFSNFTFKDHSTGHRLYEAKVVLDNFNINNFVYKLFGNGFGSTIDLSGTSDATIAASNANVHEVRHIHIGFFAILSRYGLVGILIYLSFIINMVRVSFKTLKKKNNPSITLGALYILIIIFDSFISFPHMMSNFLFWFLCAVILYENKFRTT